MAKINKVINVKVEGVGKIKQLEDSLKKLRKQQRDIKKDMKDGANAGKHAEQQYKKNENAIKSQSKALRETKKAMLDANNTTKKATSLQNSMAMGVIKGAAAFSILVTAFRRVSQALTTMIGTFTEFEFVMAKVRAVTGATDDEFKRLEDSALELGRSTFFTASEVANLQLNLSKLGFTTDEVLAATQATINLSVATGSDLARSATVAGNAIRGFQLEATEAGRVVDIMAVAFTSSALDIEKWQTSMTKVAPIAAMAGFSIEETTAIMAKLSDTGIEASIAGTSLRNIFLKMQDPTSELTRKVGHTIHSLDDMLGVFKEMVDNGTDLTDVLTFMDVRQVAAFGTMLEGADDIKALRDELEQAGGAGQLMADTVGNTLQGGIFKFKSALQGLSIFLVKKFGDSMKKTLTKMAEWLNKIVKNEKGINTLLKTVKLMVKALVGYVVASKAAVLWTKVMASGMLSFTGFVTTATGAVIRLSAALAKTGIGLFIMTAAQIAYNVLTFDEAALSAKNWSDTTTDGMIKLLKETKQYTIALEQYKTAQEKINKLKSEGITLDNAAGVAAVKLKRAMYQEATALRILNKGFKDHNIEVSKAGDAYEEVAAKHKTLIAAMKQSSAQQIFVESQKGVMQTAVSVETMVERLYADWSEMGYSGSIEHAEDWIKRHAKAMQLPAYDMGGNLLVDWGETVMSFVSQLVTDEADAATVSKYLRETFEKYVDESDLTPGTIQNVLETGITEYVDENNAIILKVLKDKYNFNLDDMIPPDDEESGKEPTSAEYELQKKITEAKQKFYKQDVTNEEQRQLGLLKAQRDGIEAYKNQYEVGDDEYTLAQNKLIEVEAKIADVKFAQAATAIERQRTAAKIAAKEDASNNELKIDGEIVDSNQLYDVLNTLDEEHNGKLLANAILYGKETKDIQSKIDEQYINSKEDNFKEAERVANEAHKKEKLDLELAYANEEISKIERDARILALEAQFLADMADLYAKYGKAHVDIDNDITENTIATKEQQKQALRDYISALGDLGGLMQDVAGEEDEMNAVRKAGIIITESAAAAEKILSLMTTLSTLATKADIALTPAKVATDGAKTGSTLALTGAKFLEAIADGIKNLPWWAQLIGVVAILGIIKKAKSNISSAFKTPDSGGGGGTDNEGGMMSLMTFGGRHQTVGEVDSYAKGGMVHGKSHAQGGEKFAVGGRVVELEGGEAVINKRSTSMFRSQLSAMNYAGGGVSFADGGVTNIPSFAKTQFDVAGQQGLQGAMSQRSKVVVVEADITQSQNTVSAIESEAAF